MLPWTLLQFIAGSEFEKKLVGLFCTSNIPANFINCDPVQTFAGRVTQYPKRIESVLFSIATRKFFEQVKVTSTAYLSMPHSNRSNDLNISNALRKFAYRNRTTLIVTDS